jgi:hypothetical protein
MKYSIKIYLNEETLLNREWDDVGRRWDRVKIKYKTTWITKNELKGTNKIDEFEARILYDKLMVNFADKEFRPVDTKWWLGKLNALRKKSSPKKYR